MLVATRPKVVADKSTTESDYRWEDSLSPIENLIFLPVVDPEDEEKRQQHHSRYETQKEYANRPDDLCPLRRIWRELSPNVQLVRR